MTRAPGIGGALRSGGRWGAGDPRRTGAAPAARPAFLSAARLGGVVLGIVGAAILSLGVHDLAIEHLGVPYPKDDAVPVAVKLLNEALRLTAVVVFCRLARGSLDGWRLLVAAGLVGGLVAALDESLRVVVIDWVILDGWRGLNGLYVVLDRAPFILFSLFRSAMAAVITRSLWPGPKWRVVVAVIVTSFLGYLILLPLMKAAVPAILSAASVSEPAPRYLPPYDGRMLPYIYGGFVEPVTSAVIMAALAWTRLGRSVAGRVGLFILLILFVRGRVVPQLVYVFWLAPPFLSAVAAEAQFFLETAVMAALAGLLWMWASRPSGTGWWPRRSLESTALAGDGPR